MLIFDYTLGIIRDHAAPSFLTPRGPVGEAAPLASGAETSSHPGFMFTFIFWGTVIFGVTMWWINHQPADKENKQDVELSESIWSTPLLCVLEQLKYPDGTRMSPLFASSVVLFMGALQMFTLFLIGRALNPDAHPITVHPSTPWNKEAWTVNCMKWIMTLFLSVFMMGDARQFQVNLREVMCIGHRHKIVRIPIIFSAMHFAVLLSTVIVGVSSVLSFQSVPDILYSSLAITFISHVDDMIWPFMQIAFGVTADWNITYREEDDTAVPGWLEGFLRTLTLFPVLVAFYILGLAWVTDVMPCSFRLIDAIAAR